MDYFTALDQGGLPRRTRRALHHRYDELDNWAKWGNRQHYLCRAPGGIVFSRGRVYRNYLETWQYWGVLSP